jgi:hypothetical protein
MSGRMMPAQPTVSLSMTRLKTGDPSRAAAGG